LNFKHIVGQPKHEKDKDRRVFFRNSQVIENLGKVDLVMTDKTGTLTENEMILRRFYVDGKVWNVQDENGPRSATMLKSVVTEVKKKIRSGEPT
jgi:P-type E1-E2 ATPase